MRPRLPPSEGFGSPYDCEKMLSGSDAIPALVVFDPRVKLNVTSGVRALPSQSIWDQFDGIKRASK
jgi:hypothetical protein